MNKARVYKTETSYDDITKYGIIKLHWDKPEGQFGAYTLGINHPEYDVHNDEMKQEIIGFSQGNDDDTKIFLRELLESLLDQVRIVE